MTEERKQYLNRAGEELPEKESKIEFLHKLEKLIPVEEFEQILEFCVYELSWDLSM